MCCFRLPFCRPALTNSASSHSSSSFQIPQLDFEEEPKSRSVMLSPPLDQLPRQQQQQYATPLAAQHQGVLYKRRDFFARQWRPRWFVLQPEMRVLTYYLFSSDEPPSITIGATPSTRRSNSNRSVLPPATPELRDSVQYDVVPRGTIYLGGCHVEADEALTRPEEQVYAFIITAPGSGNTAPCCLATTTAEAREEWIQRLSQACGETMPSPMEDGDAEEDHPTAQALFREEEGAEQQGSDITTEQNAWIDLNVEVAKSGLTPEMIDKIGSVLTKYLPYAEDENKPEHDWSTLFEDRDGVTSYQRADDGETSMIKSVATLDHHPKQIFNLVADIKRRQEYEKNVRYDERLKRCNSHTFIDYYAYQPVWPTTSREFLVLFHWRVLQRKDTREKAIVLIAFSYPQAYDLRPPTGDHVRANLDISLFLLQLLPDNKTRATRVISYDLCGSIPRSLTNTIMQQQATIPHVISSYLQVSESCPPTRLSNGDISNEILAVDVIERLPDEENGIDCVRRRLQFEHTNFSSVGGDDNESSIGLESFIEEAKSEVEEVDMRVSTLLVALILLTPLMIYKLVDELSVTSESSQKEFAFIVTAFLAVRTVVLLKLGTRMVEQQVLQSGVVSMRFSVNLRNVLRFLAKRREDDCEARELSVIPLVIKAAGKALSEMDEVNCKRTSIPLLGVKGCFLRNDIDVSVLGASQATMENIVTIRDVLKQSAEQIAFKIDHQTKLEHGGFLSKFKSIVRDTLGITEEQERGSCLVVTSPDSDGHEIDIGIAPSSGFNAVVVVGGVRMTKPLWPKSIASPTPRAPPKPMLAMTISVDCPTCTITHCRQFAERVQELVEHPDA